MVMLLLLTHTQLELPNRIFPTPTSKDALEDIIILCAAKFRPKVWEVCEM
jgi:hypothetical protein